MPVKHLGYVWIKAAGLVIPNLHFIWFISLNIFYHCSSWINELMAALSNADSLPGDVAAAEAALQRLMEVKTEITVRQPAVQKFVAAGHGNYLSAHFEIGTFFDTIITFKNLNCRKQQKVFWVTMHKMAYIKPAF
jgi:hypothetical protein